MRKHSLKEFEQQFDKQTSDPFSHFLFHQILGRVIAIELGEEPNYFAFRQRQNLLSCIDRMLTQRENQPFVPQMTYTELWYNIIAGVINYATSYMPTWLKRR